jgi:Flp pilus assembly protein TadG
MRSDGKRRSRDVGVVATAASRPRRRSAQDGAAAVEFALLAPLLMLLVLGVINFGIAFNVQETLTQAAREGVRGLALQTPSYNVSATTKNAATGMTPSSLTVTSGIQMSATGPDVTGTCATAGAVNAWVKVTKSYSFTGMPFIGSKTLTGKAYMRCGG